MKKFYIPNNQLYEEYYLNEAKQKGGNLPAFRGSRFQQGYGLGSIFKGLFRWAMPHLQQGAKVLGKKALQTGVQMAQDVLDGDDVQTAVSKRAKQVLGDLTSQNSSQSGSGRRPTKRKAQRAKNSSPPGKRAKASPQQKKPKTIFDKE